MPKECKSCLEIKPISEFYANPNTSDGHAGKCKPCTCAGVRANRKKRIDYYREYDRVRFQENPKRKARTVAVTRRRRSEVIGRSRSHSAVAYALKIGKLTRQPCSVCGRKDSHAHHDDYSKPLDVRWLCPPHHREVHGGKPF